MFETLLLWIKGLPHTLGTVVDVIITALLFITAVTLISGIWLGFFIARKRMNHILELQFFPPKITFREKDSDINKQQQGAP
jgi:hypothetical protein